MTRFAHRDLIPALALILLGAWALWQTLEMSVLGAVFPRLAGGGMLIGGLAIGLRALLLVPPVRIPEGELVRPLLLLALLLIWAVLLPYTGFVATSICGAILAMFLAADDRPSPRSVAVQGVSLALLVGLVALLFGEVLMGKLP